MKTEDLKRDYKMYLNQIKRQIPEILKNGPLKRKTIIDKAVELSPLTPDDKKDFRASGILALYRSIVGTALQRMQQYGDICVNDHNEISLSKKPSVIVREAEVARYIIELLKTGTLTAKEILLACIKYFGADKTPSASDDDDIDTLVRKLLPSLTKRGKLTYAYGKYSLSSDTMVIKKPTSLFEEFIAMLNSKGGEFFENYSALLLDNYYRSIDMNVGYCNVIGGSDDGGIDVMLQVSDQLGFEDKILVQCKQKTNSAVTLKELKEFVGAFYVEKGTRGIFMTTSRFHKEASKLFGQLHNIIPIDGPKLFELAKKCQCGLKADGEQYTVDKEFFAV